MRSPGLRGAPPGAASCVLRTRCRWAVNLTNRRALTLGSVEQWALCYIVHHRRYNCARPLYFVYDTHGLLKVRPPEGERTRNKGTLEEPGVEEVVPGEWGGGEAEIKGGKTPVPPTIFLPNTQFSKLYSDPPYALGRPCAPLCSLRCYLQWPRCGSSPGAHQ